MMAPEHVAAAVVFLAALIGLCANPVARWLDRGDADLDRLHPKIEDPRHGCCAPPKLCQGHAPECGGRQHPLGRVPWPCNTLQAIDDALGVLPPGLGVDR